MPSFSLCFWRQNPAPESQPFANAENKEDSAKLENAISTLSGEINRDRFQRLMPLWAIGLGAGGYFLYQSDNKANLPPDSDVSHEAWYRRDRYYNSMFYGVSAMVVAAVSIPYWIWYMCTTTPAHERMLSEFELDSCCHDPSKKDVISLARTYGLDVDNTTFEAAKSFFKSQLPAQTNRNCIS